MRCYYALLLGVVFSLTGCQMLPRGSVEDGAPPGPPPRWFKRVVPKQEPLSRYGNPKSYSVRGKRYEVMHSARGYHERGLASWYGTKFHQKRTSSGEPYDMYALTAAHKTLPLPTYLRVKNLDNGQEAIVKVNDRGPFHSQRVLDLSYGAAVKLGLYPKGTAHVELTAIVVGEAKQASASGHYYYLQAGVFANKTLAINWRKQLVNLTHASVSIEPYARRYVVKIGPLASLPASQQLRTKLLMQGVRSVVKVVNYII